MPRLSFDDPLPLGMASEAEHMRIRVSTRFSCDQVVQGINTHLPQGLRITGCRLKSEIHEDGVGFSTQVQKYRIEFSGLEFNTALLDQFQACSQWPYLRPRQKRADQPIDLKAAVKKIECRNLSQIYMEIDTQTQFTVRPADFLVGVLQLTPIQLQQVVITKLAG